VKDSYLLVEHLNTGQDSLEAGAHTDNLDFSTLLNGTTLDTAGSDGTTTRDGENI
jgi:hypothetical protein